MYLLTDKIYPPVPFANRGITPLNGKNAIIDLQKKTVCIEVCP